MSEENWNGPMWGRLNIIAHHADSGTAIEYLQGKTIANTVDLHSKTTKEEVTKTISEKPGNYRFRVKFSSLKHQTVQSMLSMCRRSCRVRPFFFSQKFWNNILIQNHYQNKSLPEIIQLYGGLDDHIIDDFGFKIPICTENGGLPADER